MRHTGKVQATLAFMVTAGFFGVLWVLMTAQTGGFMRDSLLIMVGALGAAFGSVVNYYFGSSSGSAAKNALLAGKDDAP